MAPTLHTVSDGSDRPAKYVECGKGDVPGNVRFDVPARLAGQHVEVAYGGFGRAEHDEGDLYKRVTDRSIGPGAVAYYRLLVSEKQPRG